MKTIDELGISPWPWRISKTCKASVMDADYRLLVHDSPFTMEYRPGGEMICDSTLIAAAPELYEAFRGLYDYCFASYTEQFNSFEDVCAKAEAALAKASGEEVA